LTQHGTTPGPRPAGAAAAGVAAAPRAKPRLDPGADVRRSEFSRLGSGIYLNAASFGPLPDRSLVAGRAFQEWRGAAALQPADIDESLAGARRACARLVGAAAAEIALTPNTTAGLNLAADIVAQAGSGKRAIIVPDREFPANVYAWMSLEREGFRLELLPVDGRGCPSEDALLHRLTRGDVAAVAISAVQFATGYRADLERLGRSCREHGALFVVDAIQALGSVPLDVKAAGVDVLACGGQKWLCGPFGTGFAYVRAELCERFEPHRPGWLSFRSTADFSRLLDYSWDLWDDARRFEVGSLAIQSFVELAHGVELILEVGVDRIFDHLLQLQLPLLEWAEATGRAEPLLASRDNASGILALRVDDAAGLSSTLAAAGVNCAPREGAIRFAPHLYNTRTELDRVVGLLRATLG
jgi:cysteine desulfurase / selenocysteine lyase